MRQKGYEAEAALWNFARTEGVEPASNAAERALRKRALWCKTRIGGVRLVERVLSVIETCRRQRRSTFDLLCDAIPTHRCAAPAPLLFS